MDGFDCLGVEEVVGFDVDGVLKAASEVGAFDAGALLQAAGGVAQYGIAAAEKDKAEKKSAADEKASIDKAIAADVSASNAVARAAVSAQLKSASAAVDASAATTAVAAQDRAGIGLSSDAADKRADAAEKQLALATKNAQAKPTDGFAAALVGAWTATLNKAHNTSIVASGDEGGKGKKDKGGSSGESFMTRKVLGPIPGYGVVLGGAGLFAGLVIVVKKIFFK